MDADPSLKNSDGKTALDIATQEGFEDIIEELKKAREVATQTDQSLLVPLQNFIQKLKTLYQALSKK